MRLKCIRLAGFKSFVDPTTVSFPGNMSAVVGPNGCGKSNIIDAVRWVMGESSAKNLRGESMADVIFNGSTTRKPVSQASIELVFDNSDRTLVGEFAAFNEISIRRRVTREGQSQYFLNGAKCRRRDITDIFLGTGLGPRSYAIIEQGMISRLIEARPEDLRNFLEEAAGISRYKERRRETEGRIRRTHENLERLTDLREELERQIDRLHRQAQAAEQYQLLKAEERELRAQLTALRWQQLDERAGQRKHSIGEQEVALEALIAQQRAADAAIEQLRDGRQQQAEDFSRVQAQFYALASDIARSEQSIQHEQQRVRQLRDDLREAELARQESRQHLTSDRELLASLDEELEMLEPEQAEREMQAEELAAVLEEAEMAMHDWQQQWDACQQRHAASSRAAELQQAQIRQLEHSLQKLLEREQRLRGELQQLALQEGDEDAALLAEYLAEAEMHLEQLQEQEAALAASARELQSAIETDTRALQQLHGEQQRNAGRIASLEALQQAAREPDAAAAQWLRQQQLERQPRLGDGLRVAPGWELAVETVLGADLQAVLVDELAADGLSSFQRGSLDLLLEQPRLGAAVAGSLLEQVSAPLDLSAWLGGVRCVEDLDSALAARASLGDGESLISRDGYWVGRHFLRIRRGKDGGDSLLARAAELERLQDEQAMLEERIEQAEAAIAARREQRSAQDERRNVLRRQLQEANRQLSEQRARLSAVQARAEQLGQRRQRIEHELAELAEQHLMDLESLGEARMALEQALEAMAVDHEQRERLQHSREQQRGQLEQQRRASAQAREAVHQLALRLGALRTRRDGTRQALERLQLQAERLDERCAQLSLGLEEGDEPLVELRMRLEGLLEQRLEVDERMQAAQARLDASDLRLRELEQGRQQAEQQAQLLRSQLEQQRLDWHTLGVHRENLEQQLAEDAQNLPALLAALPADASEADYEQRLGTIGGRVQRLGAINLAAIEEYRQQSERKAYLDAQNADLVEALDTLENVIRRIDRETRNRFKETFDQVNAGLQHLFPKVFGGGSATLELTGDDLLETGVAIMARPPGKKNSTIHLLSGGEKALTALSLVFAIFQLNPAPFCMLDEVDAPLDDANVGRYARLVKEMSDKVQFIYITHNKIAMEMADQLLGVTMHEPGCSRLVAVDIEEAAALAAS